MIRIWLLVVVLGGCGTDGDTVDGTWSGSWMGGGATGNLVFELSQSGDTVAGSVTFTGSVCFSGGGVTGTVHDSEFFGSITAGQLRVDFDSTISGARLDGSFNAIAAGSCTGSMGSFEATP